MAAKKYKVLITNPVSEGGHPDVVIKGVVVKGYIAVPVEAGIFEVYYGKKYLGEAITKSQIKQLIERDGADAPVLIQNPNGGYEQMPFKYKSPSSNPKKKRGKKKAKKRKAKRRTKKKATKRRKKVTKRKVKRKAKRKTKRKSTKRRGKKTSVRKKKRIYKAKKKVKKATRKAKGAKRKVRSAKKKVSGAKKAVRKAKGALSKAKRSKNPTPNPHKRRKKKVAKEATRSRATMGDVNAYVRRVTGKKF